MQAVALRTAAVDLIQTGRSQPVQNPNAMADAQPPRPHLERLDLIPTRATLLSRLKGSATDESWREFFETYWKLIYNTARRAGLPDSEAQDVVQETMLALTRHLPHFEYDPERCSFKTWLRNLTRWRILDQIRTRKSAERIEQAVRSFVEFGALEEGWDCDWQLNLAEEALRRVQASAPPRQVQAFSTCVLQGKGALLTARLLGMSVPAVYVATLRMKRLIRNEAAKIEKGAVS
jgi:RNA polymerase sigma factor (sigma-70 family)